MISVSQPACVATLIPVSVPQDLPVRAHPHAGTAGYRAPEAGSQQAQYTPALDVYAMSIMIYQLLEGALPFGDFRHHQQVVKKPAALSTTQWQVLQSGLALSAEQRPASALALLQAMVKSREPHRHLRRSANRHSYHN